MQEPQTPVNAGIQNFLCASGVSYTTRCSLSSLAFCRCERLHAGLDSFKVDVTELVEPEVVDSVDHIPEFKGLKAFVCLSTQQA